MSSTEDDLSEQCVTDCNSDSEYNSDVSSTEDDSDPEYHLYEDVEEQPPRKKQRRSKREELGKVVGSAPKLGCVSSAKNQCGPPTDIPISVASYIAQRHWHRLKMQMVSQDKGGEGLRE